MLQRRPIYLRQAGKNQTIPVLANLRTEIVAYIPATFSLLRQDLVQVHSDQTGPPAQAPGS